MHTHRDTDKPLLPYPLTLLDQDSERDYAYGAPPVKKPQYPTKTTDKRGGVCLDQTCANSLHVPVSDPRARLCDSPSIGGGGGGVLRVVMLHYIH